MSDHRARHVEPSEAPLALHEMRRAAPSHRRFVAWPGWSHLGDALVLSGAGFLLFLFVYGGCDWLTGLRERCHVHLPLELAIPLVPWTVALYMSIYGLFVLAPFVLRSRLELRALMLTLAATTVVAGVGFLALPAELAFAEPTNLGIWQGLFTVADRLNLSYNLVPSLHVALAVVCVDVFAARAALAGKLLLWGWALAISASTLLTHQHHLLDVAAGLALALAASRFLYRRLAHRRSSDRRCD